MQMEIVLIELLTPGKNNFSLLTGQLRQGGKEKSGSALKAVFKNLGVGEILNMFEG